LFTYLLLSVGIFRFHSWSWFLIYAYRNSVLQSKGAQRGLNPL